MCYPSFGVTPGTDPGSLPSAFQPANGCRIGVRHDKHGSSPSRGGGVWVVI